MVSVATAISAAEAPDDRIDYGQPDVWERLAARFDRDLEPRPSPNCGRVVCAPGWNWRTRLPDYDLWFPIKGRGTLRLRDRAYAVRAGTLLFLRPGDRPVATQDPADRLTVVYLHLDFHQPGARAPRAVPPDWLPSRCVPFPDAAQFELLLARVVRLLERRQTLSTLEAKFVLQQALLEIYRQDAVNRGFAAGRLDPRVERVTAYLRAHPECRLAREEAAALAGLSPAYFGRLFSAEIGASFREYLLRVRLERARHFLEETEMSVGEVARTLGYDDLFLFSRQFKQHYGFPPSHLRK